MAAMHDLHYETNSTGTETASDHQISAVALLAITPDSALYY
jgi:hypothetical protein